MHNLDTQTKLLLCPLLAPALVTGVHPQVREAWKVLASRLQKQLNPVLVRYFGAVYLGFEDQALRIYEQVSLSAANLLAAIVSPVFATHSGGFGRL
jgi:hypothetical protein